MCDDNTLKDNGSYQSVKNAAAELLRRGAALFELREYTAGEVIADGVVHAIGIVASLVGVIVLLTMAAPLVEQTRFTALSVYSVTLIAMFCFSAAYNLVPHKSWKPLLRRFDQAAIFLKIAGTYTPLVILIGSAFSYLLLALVWIAALAGASAKLIFRPRRDRYSIPLYLVLGWASLFLVWPMAETMHARDAWLILAGGLLYTVGIVFHVWDRLKFQNAIWHGFVLAAAGCHFSAVAHASFATGL